VTWVALGVSLGGGFAFASGHCLIDPKVTLLFVKSEANDATQRTLTGAVCGSDPLAKQPARSRTRRTSKR
jgi:hypothetical protein